METSELYSLIEARRIEKGLSQAELGVLALGQNNSSVIQAIRRGSSPTASKLEAICRALGLEFYIGPPRDDAPIQHGTISGADYAAIPRRDVTAAAGAGAQNGEEDIIGTLAFRRDWLAGRGIAASNAVLITVMGDSMTPLIWDGDTVMVDTSRREPAIRGRDTLGNPRSDIYALERGGDTRIKWVERPEKSTLILYSENFSNYPPEVLLGADVDEVRIIGKVVWWGHAVS